MKKFALRGLIGLAVMVALCIFFSGTVRTLTTPKVRFAPAKMGKFEQTTNLKGKVVFPQEEEIRVPVPEGLSLTVTRVKVTAGDRVKQGETLISARISEEEKQRETLRKDFDTARESLRALEKKTGEIRLSASERSWQAAWEKEQRALSAERDARIALQAALRQAGLTLSEENQTLPEEAGEEIRSLYAAWQEAESAWKGSQMELKALDRYAIPEETWSAMRQMKEYEEKMADCEEKLTDLEILKKQAEEITAPHAGYISQVGVEKGNPVDGDTVILKMTPAEQDPVIRCELEDMTQEVSEGTKLTVESDSWGRTETRVVARGMSLEGHPYIDCEITQDVRYALGSVAAMMKDEVKLKLTTRSRDSTCLLPASAVRGSGADRYVYVAGKESSTFGGSRMKCEKQNVTVLGENGSLVSLAEDLTWQQVVYMEDRALKEGAVIMSYDGE